MYVIKNIVGGKTYVLHDQRSESFRVLEPHLLLTVNKTGQLTFEMLPTHEHYNTIKKLESVIQVIEDGELIYEGRALEDESDFRNVKLIKCEGSMGYLLDSLQRPFSYSGSVQELLKKLIDTHNVQVEPRKQFFLGRVNVAADMPEMKLEHTKLSNTWDAVNNLLIDRLVGCLWVQFSDGKKYLNYTHDHGGINEQRIQFGVNLLDLNRYMDATQIATCLIPYGANLEYTDELGEKKTRVVDITSVNGGRDYIEAPQALIDQYGKIWATYQWTDVIEPENLLAKAKVLLNDLTSMPETLKVSALDLNYTGVDIRRFHVGYWTTIESKPHGIEKNMMLSRLDLYMDDPKKGSISLGSTVQTFTASTIKGELGLSKAIEQTANNASAEINRKVENATNLITGGLGGYVVLDNIDPNTGKKMHPWRILIMNTPDKATAKNVIQLNQNGLGFSTTGINGPYRNAWTIDGNLVADFITAGTMLADRIRGGTLELGGTGLGRDGSIVVMDAAGKRIGSWDKSGLSILKGILQGVSAIFGGVDNQNGAIEVKDASGRTIGRWDKDGLYINRGAIEGGTINIGNGTFQVDRDGSVSIESGEISIGPVIINESMLEMGVFRLASSNVGVFYSKDRNIEIWTNHPDWGFATIFVGNGEGDTKITKNAINSKNVNAKNDISISSLVDETGWEPKWMSVKRNIIELWDRIESIENSIQS